MKLRHVIGGSVMLGALLALSVGCKSSTGGAGGAGAAEGVGGEDDCSVSESCASCPECPATQPNIGDPCGVPDDACAVSDCKYKIEGKLVTFVCDGNGWETQ
jgi:hypothetical protein